MNEVFVAIIIVIVGFIILLYLAGRIAIPLNRLRKQTKEGIDLLEGEAAKVAVMVGKMESEIYPKLKIIHIPKELQTGFQQYLLFFREYVVIAKKKELHFEVKLCEEGLEVLFTNPEQESLNKIETYLDEYMNFARENRIGIIKVENNPKPVEVDNLRIRLEQQISNLNLELKYSKLNENLMLEKINFLESERKELLNKVNVDLHELLRPVEERNSIDQELRSELKKKLSQNKIDEVYITLKPFLELNNKAKFNNLIILEQNWRSIRQEKLTNQISFDDYSIEIAKMTNSLIQVIDQC